MEVILKFTIIFTLDLLNAVYLLAEEFNFLEKLKESTA